MENFERLIKDLPARIPPAGSQCNGEKAIHEAVLALPLANPTQAIRQVEQLLEDMLATIWVGAERIAALEHLRVPVESLCVEIERQLGTEPHPFPAAAAELAAAAQWLQGMLMCGYAVGLHELCAPAGKLPMFKSKLAATATVRGLVHADRVLIWSYRQYQSPSADVWRRVHALHGFASELAIADRKIGDALVGGAPLNARTAYVHLLLLAMSNPYRFSARELQEARQVIRCIAGQCKLTRVSGKGIGVDTNSDVGPGYIAEERIAAKPGVLTVDVTPAERMFDEQIRIALLPQGTDTIELPQPGGGVLTTSVRFLNRLRTGWGPVPRGYTRLAARHALDIVVGMHALHYALAGNVDFATFVRRVHGDAIIIGTHELAAVWLAKVDTTPPQVFRAEVLDQSEGGYRLRLHRADGVRMRIGEVVGLSPVDEDDERDWMVGVIRWLRHNGEDELLGIELLRREARAAGLRPLTADGKTLPPMRAVELLDGLNAQHLSLLTAHCLARDTVAAEVVLPACVSDWNSHATVSTWRTGDTEELGPACFRVTLERDEASVES